jgi:predicted nucleic acid-binding Zn ribbon protein
MRGDTDKRVLVSIKTDAHPKELYYICRSSAYKHDLIAAMRDAATKHENVYSMQVKRLSDIVIDASEIKQ